MSKCVIKHLPVLKELAITTPKKRLKLLEAANLELIKSIVECVENVLKGNVTLKKKCINKLKKFKTILHKIFNTGKKLTQKKKIIVQNGGAFLPALLASLIPVLVERALR